MLSTDEAARHLNISRRRVVALIHAGKLKAEKTSGVWLIDEDSVKERANASKKGGRPARGFGANETRFTLMNRTHPVADVVYNEENHEFSHIGETLDPARAPLCFAAMASRIPLARFNRWWRGRGIPETRNNLASLLRQAGARIPEELLRRNLGLSLSDQYWIRPAESGLRWEDVNFFTNSFDAVDRATAQFFAEEPGIHAHPQNTSDGNLEKTWLTAQGVRTLAKGAAHNGQEPYNEVVATALHRRLLSPSEYVEYRLDDSASPARCLCANFLTDEEEYVPALHVMEARRQAPNESDYQHFLTSCDQLGVTGEAAALDRMIVCDDILANTDRHFRNFGIIRNVETLACRPAPIFDSGTSLWCDTDDAALARGEHSFASKQFYANPAKQLLLVQDFSWFDPARLDGFIDEAIEILSGDMAIAHRLPFVRRALEFRISRMAEIAEWS